jgi:hypothetical protein
VNQNGLLSVVVGSDPGVTKLFTYLYAAIFVPFVAATLAPRASGTCAAAEVPAHCH